MKFSGVECNAFLNGFRCIGSSSATRLLRNVELTIQGASTTKHLFCALQLCKLYPSHASIRISSGGHTTRLTSADSRHSGTPCHVLRAVEFGPFQSPAKKTHVARAGKLQCKLRKLRSSRRFTVPTRKFSAHEKWYTGTRFQFPLHTGRTEKRTSTATVTTKSTDARETKCSGLAGLLARDKRC